jgi:hypothetical protein
MKKNQNGGQAKAILSKSVRLLLGLVDEWMPD